MDVMETIFQHSQTSDLEIIQAIAKKTIDQSYRYFLGDQVVDNYLNSGRLDKYLSNNIDNTWVLSIDHTIVGFAICIDNVIDFMMVDVDYHRQGLGTKLLQHCESYLFKKHQIIALESFEENTKATKFYQANNWEITEKYRDPKANAIKIIFRKKFYTVEEQQRQTAIGANPYQ